MKWLITYGSNRDTIRISLYLIQDDYGMNYGINISNLILEVPMIIMSTTGPLKGISAVQIFLFVLINGRILTSLEPKVQLIIFDSVIILKTIDFKPRRTVIDYTCKNFYFSSHGI